MRVGAWAPSVLDEASERGLRGFEGRSDQRDSQGPGSLALLA